MNDVYKALADPTRREILRILRRGPLSAGVIAERFDLSKPSMSHHFMVLQQADLIAACRNGRQIVYALNTTVVQDVLSSVLEIFGQTPIKAKGRKEELR